MKTDVKQNGMWWSWIENCNRCGKSICTHLTKRNYKPDMEEADFCVECLRYLLDNNISHTDVNERYKK